MKVISFCLWGDKKKYTIGALRNLEIASKIYPGWTCIFYCDESVPHEILSQIQKHENSKLYLFKNSCNWKFNLSRLLALEEDNAEYIIFRDTDSRLSFREKHAVEEWIKSGKACHIMRDHPYHGSFPILAGMFGLKKGAIKNIVNKISNFHNPEHYHYDQIFISKYIYQEIKNNCLVHDEFFEKKPFPTKRINYEFVGEVYSEFDEAIEEHRNALAASL